MSRKAIPLALLLVACAPKYTWPEFRLSQALSTDRYAGVNAAIVDSVDRLEYQMKGDKLAAKLTRYRRVKVYTPEGVRSAEVHLPFSARMKLAEYDGRSFLPEGNEAKRSKAVLSDITILRPLADQGVREVGELVMKIPDVVPGSTFDYMATYEIPDAFLIEPILMRDRLPAERAELLIIAPKAADFDLRFLENGQSKAQAPMPTEAPSQDQAAYRFVLRNQPALIQEENMPSPARIGPAVWPVFRGMKGTKATGPRLERWEDVRTWLQKQYRLTSAGKSDGDPEKLQSAFVAEATNMTVVDSYLRMGERPIGGGKDRISMGLKLYDALATRGFKVGVGLVSRESAGLLLPEVPSPVAFDAVLPAIVISGKTIFLDPACAACPLDQVSQPLEGAPVVALFEDGARVETLPTRNAKDNAYSLTLSMKLGIKGDVIGAAQAVMAGAPAANVRAAFAKKNNELFAKELGMLKELPLSNVASPDSDQATQTFEASFDLVGQCKEDAPARLRCGMDMFFEKLLPDMWRESRTQDLLLPATYSYTLLLTIQIPTKAHVEPPQPMAARSRFGEYSLQYQYEPGQLSLTRRFVLGSRKVPADQYDEFHDFIEQARRYDAAMPLIELFADEPGGAAPAQSPDPKGKKPKKK